METSKPSMERFGIVTGVITSLTLIAYFMLMKVLGLAHILELRFFNFVIIAIALFISIRKYKERLHEREFYLKGLGEGMMVTATTTVIFGVFMGFYLAYMDRALLETIKTTASVGEYLDPLMIVFSIFLEGMASGAVITFAIMQYLKTNGTVMTRKDVREAETGTSTPNNNY